jgi:hypothetical protein
MQLTPKEALEPRYRLPDDHLSTSALGLTMKHVLVVALLLTGCGQKERSPQNAVGDTPVRQVMCGAGDQDCVVVARFSDFQSCEWHNKISNMLCDSMSNPGTVTCTTPTSTSTHSYCTQ